MVIPDWLTRRIAIAAVIYLEIFAAKGYFPHRWAILFFIIVALLWFQILHPKTIYLARKNSE